MSDKWRGRYNPDSEVFNDDYEVKPRSHSHRRKDDEISSGSSSRFRNSDKEKHRHQEKSHKKDKRKSRSRSPSHKRKRSTSRSRDQDDCKSYDKRDRYTRDERSYDDRYHDSRYSNRSDRYPGPSSSSADSYRNKCRLFALAKSKEDSTLSVPNSTLNQPQPLAKSPISEAARLKEEIEKRKLLWSKKDKPAESIVPPVWKTTAFSDDSDGKVSAKFKRLMGMKGDIASERDSQSSNSSDVTKNQEYLENLEKQYEVARATTHTQRGLGLGFSSGRLWPR